MSSHLRMRQSLLHPSGSIRRQATLDSLLCSACTSWAKERYSEACKHVGERGKKNMEVVNGTGACEPGRVQGPPVAVCKANRNGQPASQPNTGLLANTGECALRQAPARRRAEFSLQTEAPTGPGRWATAQERAWAEKGTPAQWAAAAESTAACSTL